VRHAGGVYGALSAPVERFVTRLTPILASVSDRSGSGLPRDRLENDVVVEASNLVAAFLDADGRQTDDELWAYISAFGPRFDTNLRKATPEDVRKAGLVTGKVAWTAKP